MTQADFVALLLRGPVAAATFALLEEVQRVGPELARSSNFSVAPTSPSDLRRAVEALETDGVEKFLSAAVHAGFAIVGPWKAFGEVDTNAAIATAESRRSLAEAVVELWGEILLEELNPDEQEWWSPSPPFPSNLPAEREETITNHLEAPDLPPSTVGAVWTISSPPAAICDDLLGAWEWEDRRGIRWSVPVNEFARVYEIREPRDWFALRDSPWETVANQYDAAHLSWAGFLTTEGVSPPIGAGVDQLRGWFSERSLWLNDVFRPEISEIGYCGVGPAPTTRELDESRTHFLRKLGRAS